MVLLPIVQFAKLTDETKAQILWEIFRACEYDSDDLPGADPDASDLAQVVFGQLEKHGIKFTHPDRRPHGYRFNQHTQKNNEFCRWSHTSVVEPMSRTHLKKGNIHCPAGCPDSVVEADPKATEEQEHGFSVYALIVYLSEAGIPSQAVDTSGGTWTVYIGDGGWDEATERYTQPISMGPCVMVDGRLMGETFETYYGVRGDDKSYPLEGCDDPQDIADHIIRLHSEWPAA